MCWDLDFESECSKWLGGAQWPIFEKHCTIFHENDHCGLGSILDAFDSVSGFLLVIVFSVLLDSVEFDHGGVAVLGGSSGSDLKRQRTSYRDSD